MKLQLVTCCWTVMAKVASSSLVVSASLSKRVRPLLENPRTDESHRRVHALRNSNFVLPQRSPLPHAALFPTRKLDTLRHAYHLPVSLPDSLAPSSTTAWAIFSPLANSPGMPGRASHPAAQFQPTSKPPLPSVNLHRPASTAIMGGQMAEIAIFFAKENESVFIVKD